LLGLIQSAPRITRRLPLPWLHTRRNDLRNIRERSYLKILLSKEREFCKGPRCTRKCVPRFYSSIGRRRQNYFNDVFRTRLCGIVFSHGESRPRLRCRRHEGGSEEIIFLYHILTLRKINLQRTL